MQLSDEVRAFLDGKWIARMTTMGPDGYPHTVPIWYMREGDEIVLATGRGARKLKNIAQNPKGAVVIGGEARENFTAYEDAYLFQGEFTVEPDPEDGFAVLRRIGQRYREDFEQLERDMQEWGPHDVIRLRVNNVIRVMP